jgi:hypothetical protein
VVTIPKSHRKIVERRKIDTFATQIHDPSLSWLGTGTSPNSGKAEIVLWFLLLQKKQKIIHSPPRSTMNNMSFNQERMYLWPLVVITRPLINQIFKPYRKTLAHRMS